MKGERMKKTFLSIVVVTSLVSFANADMAVDHLTIEAQPDSPATFGWGYDTKQKQTKSMCVEFTSMDTYYAGEPKKETIFTLAENNSEIVKNSGLSASASLKALVYGGTVSANNKTTIVGKTEASQYNLTLFASVLDYDPPKFIHIENVRLKPEMIEMLNDPKRKAEFRQRCGDGFIIGIQEGRDFLGTATVKKQTLKQSTELATETGLGVKYPGYEGKADVNYTEAVKNIFGSSNFEIRTYSTGADMPNPSNVDELKKYYENFSKNSNNYKRTVKYIVVPYSILPNFPSQNIFYGDTKEAYIGYMADVLWDLKAAIKDAEFVLSPYTQSFFALGSNNIIKKRRINAIYRYKDKWQKEFKDLLKAAKQCDKKFTKKCESLASFYNEKRRLQLENIFSKVLPDRYISDCYSPVEINLNDGVRVGNNIVNLSTAFNGKFDVIEGDTETGGNKVRVVAQLKLRPENRRLRADLSVAKIEWKKSRYKGMPLVTKNKKINPGDSGFARQISEYIFDLDDDRGHRSLKTCTWSRPLTKNLRRLIPGLKGYGNFRRYGFDGGYVYGLIDSISKKDARYQSDYGPGRGLLKKIRCEVDAKGRHDNELGCEKVEFKTFYLNLVSLQDQFANRWRDPNAYAEPAILVNFLRNKAINYKIKTSPKIPMYKLFKTSSNKTSNETPKSKPNIPIHIFH
ncbi:conserved hypothetical protein [Lebetimonas natsushimae]|uniref:Uncharacterized protein n=2 Tax=Lebetimonas natsushimae TaxID=1936991 RepID=A0A292YBU8_9BACT|nr:conserved hypothetical protein [Lebetimonas natsushimae]